ncbi:MAG: hypothetical protein WC787_00130 [Patescibacteria group bacterium]|jgi:hypothetical protein
MPDLPTALNPEIPPASVEASRNESTVEADERAYEQLPEAKEHFLETPAEDAPTTTISIQKPAQTAKLPRSAPARARVVDDVTVRIEQILEKDLGALYETLPMDARPVFKQKGEEVSDSIATMIRSARVEASRVVRLIRDWLLTIPNVNKFFLEQEAKIKTDALLEYVEARKEDLAKHP